MSETSGKHPLDEARDRLLASVDAASREVLSSKLSLIRLAREEESAASAGRIAQEQAARGSFNSGATIQRSWDAALVPATVAAETSIDACLNVGVSDDGLIASFVSEDLKHFLTAFITSRFGHQGPTSMRAVAMHGADANARAGRVRDQVRSRRFDRDKATTTAKETPKTGAVETRDKQQKFGILDSPNLLAADLSGAPGILGRAVVYLDIDHFKMVNTKFSERVVDRTVLPALHSLVANASSGIGYAYGEGGDEIVVYLPNASIEMGVAFAHALRRLIAEHPFFVDGQDLRLTASFGVAADSGASGSALADQANLAKQHSKDNGRNCVSLHTTSGPAVCDEEQGGAAALPKEGAGARTAEEVTGPDGLSEEQARILRAKLVRGQVAPCPKDQCPLEAIDVTGISSVGKEFVVQCPDCGFHARLSGRHRD